ncbi:hypothetical protein GCM10022252_74050 [Streptosporangium oxazolinicum]|uniref:Uncharacterized protein n=1 Tax=Streptosporangium oxazolinicum TaxID=909287 RepID=A0ABP8BJT9_9ACTN
MIVADPPLEQGGTARWFYTADEPRGGERVKALVHGLEGDLADTVTHSRGECLDIEMVTVSDGFEQCDTGRRHP